MATLILTVATATAAPGSFLATASAAQLFALSIGAAAIDSFLIFPAFFKPDAVEGQRLNGLNFFHTEEGSPANRLFGKAVRIAGTLIWMDGLREVEDAESSGKGGSEAEFLRFRYFAHCAIEIGRLKRGKQIKKVKQVFADGKLFYNESGIESFISTNISATVKPFFIPPGTEIYQLQLISDESAGGPDLTFFQSGRNITISGFANTHPFNATNLFVETDGATSAQNGTGDLQVRMRATIAGLLSENDTIVIQGGAESYTIAASVTFDGSGTDYKNVTLKTALTRNLTDGLTITPTTAATNNNSASGSTGINQVIANGRLSATQSFITVQRANLLTHPYGGKAAGDTITLSQEDNAFSKTQAADVRFYYGSRDQSPDPTIVEVEEDKVGGAANVPAFRSRAYMVVEDLEVTDYGNRLPSFDFIVEVEDDDSLASAVGEIFQDAGLTTSEFDVSAIPTTTKLGGYSLIGPQNIKSALQPLMLAYHLVSQQDEGIIKLIPRTATTLLDVTGKTIAYSPGSASPRPAKIKDIGDTKSPQIAVVRFFDINNDYQLGEAKADGPVKVSANVTEFDTNISMDRTQALQLANTLFELGRISARRTVEFDLPPSYIDTIKESLRVRINDTTKFKQDMQFLVLRVDEGNNYILKCEGVEEDLEPFTQTVTAEQPI